MILIENCNVYGWEAALRGMRNSFNSWDKSDTAFTNGMMAGHMGEADLSLAQKLAWAGSDHGKFLRMINVSMDITAPMYWWKEFDTYKVGTVRNSCSTMHKIHAKEFTLDDFSHEHLLGYDQPKNHIGGVRDSADLMDEILMILNYYRAIYLETKNKTYWYQLIQLLPSSYNQRSTVLLNYAVLRNMYAARKEHKLDEWRDFCGWIERMPYSELITVKG